MVYTRCESCIRPPHISSVNRLRVVMFMHSFMSIYLEWVHYIRRIIGAVRQVYEVHLSDFGEDKSFLRCVIIKWGNNSTIKGESVYLLWSAPPIKWVNIEKHFLWWMTNCTNDDFHHEANRRQNTTYKPIYHTDKEIWISAWQQVTCLILWCHFSQRLNQVRFKRF